MECQATSRGYTEEEKSELMSTFTPGKIRESAKVYYLAKYKSEQKVKFMFNENNEVSWKSKTKK